MTFSPTPEQSAIYSHLADTNQSLIVEALAGSGKTTTLVQLATHAPEPSILALAFNKHAKEDLEAKMPPKVICKTMNGLGHGIIQRHLGGRVTLNMRKTTDIIKRLGNEGEIPVELTQGDPLYAMSRAVGFAKQFGMGCPDLKWPQKPLVENTPQVWDDIFDNYEIELPSSAIKHLQRILSEEAKAMFYREINFDDQIWGPVVFRMGFQQFPLVLVDEAQDLSPIQHIMVERSTKGRIVAVGDRRQAIYGFRGASVTSMDDFRNKFEADELPLSICFRCSESVVREAHTYTPHMRWRDGAPQGTVRELPSWSAEEVRKCPERVAILCRNNAPLFSIAYKLMAAGLGVEMKGTDIGKAMLATLNKVLKGVHDSATTSAIIPMLTSWVEHEKETAQRKERPWLAQRAVDRFESFLAIMNHCETLGELKNEISVLFAPKASKVILSSIHRSKGLEFQDVFFLDSQLIPSKYARTPDQRAQEDNLAYVAITRAQVNLHYVTSDTWTGPEAGPDT
jgi:hypothetical protein